MPGINSAIGRWTVAATAAAGLALCAAPSLAQDYGYSDDGAYTVPEVRVTPELGRDGVMRASRIVEFGDLDVGSDWGARALHRRIEDAARSACRELDRRDPINAGDSECVDNAVSDAMDEAVSEIGFTPPGW
jgi:UrcA family protein